MPTSAEYVVLENGAMTVNQGGTKMGSSATLVLQSHNQAALDLLASERYAV
jgi:hypothetical protein